MRSLVGASLALALATLAACTVTETIVEQAGPGRGEGPGAGGSGADGGKKPVVPGTHFEAEGAWTVPLGGFAGAGFNNVSSGRWATMDLDGDRKPDLVVPSDPSDSSSRVWGFDKAPYWKVYKSGSGGFAEESTWTVPAGGFAGAGFNNVASGK